jgi:hypothetical protein
MRLRAAAADVRDVARDLARAADDVGLRGPAGVAVQHLVDDVAAQVRGLADACDRAAEHRS